MDRDGGGLLSSNQPISLSYTDLVRLKMLPKLRQNAREAINTEQTGEVQPGASFSV